MWQQGGTERQQLTTDVASKVLSTCVLVVVKLALCPSPYFPDYLSCLPQNHSRPLPARLSPTGKPWKVPGTTVLRPRFPRVAEHLFLFHGHPALAQSAIEIGDPKMDLGARRHQDVGTPEELIAAGHAPIDLSAPQLLNLMDQLMVLEAAWHDGGMLPQTVFTSLYMLQTDRCVG